MKIICIAIGPQHEQRSAGLLTAFPDAIRVTSATLLPAHQHEDNFIAARLAKTGFAQYLPEDYEGPVCLIDSDVVINPEAFDELPELTAPIAGVAPHGETAKALLPAPFAGQFTIGALNSGVLFFPSVAAAQQISAAWHAKYLSQYEVWRNDELALYFALEELEIAVQYLTRRFNSPDPFAMFRHGGGAAWPKQTVPRFIANWRAKAVLRKHNLKAAVEAALEAMPGDAGEDAREAYNGNADFNRYGPTIAALAAALNLTPNQLDALFIEASAITV